MFKRKLWAEGVSVDKWALYMPTGMPNSCEWAAQWTEWEKKSNCDHTSSERSKGT
jgi:hypothetical protein